MVRCCVAVVLMGAGVACAQEAVTFESLLRESVSLERLAAMPAYRQLQASSSNRASVKRGEPAWFADGDGAGFIREETNAGRREWVAMEQTGPGCITRMWAPFFYHDYNDRRGPTVRVYLDGGEAPAIEARWIELITGGEWPGAYGENPPNENALKIPAPFAAFTARAGDCYLPIPFARSCRVTFDAPPFYYAINSRAYPEGTAVETFDAGMLDRSRGVIGEAARGAERVLAAPARPALQELGAGKVLTVSAARGPARIDSLWVHVDPNEISSRPELLRGLELRLAFDGVETVRCPLGDYFGSRNAINPFGTMARVVRAEGDFGCAWVMPYARGASVTIANLSDAEARVAVTVSASGAPFVAGSMYFCATWEGDREVRGDRFEDLTFLDAWGEGVLVGDQWTVLNATDGWWGEGDEKIVIDGEDDAFPDHFGTGTEDYYGWAGGVNPTARDVFDHPWLANIAVGSVSGPTAAEKFATTRGYNICARHRGLDAIPFRRRLRFDMEASPGVDQRRETDVLVYSSIVFWYSRAR